MKLVAIIAENANAALAQVHEQLGPDAVVVSVRKIPSDGIFRLWHRGQKVEVTACVPDETPKNKKNAVAPADDAPKPFAKKIETEAPAKRPPGNWRNVSRVESMLLPLLTDRLEQKLCAPHRDEPPSAPDGEWAALSDRLAGSWRPARQVMTGTKRPHVFIGPAGSGKTTALCKWMTSAVLVNEHSVRVWRLDGESANASEFLPLHCEMLGVPVERFWNAPGEWADLNFVDLPGVEIRNPSALSALRHQLAALPQPHIHLVLNAAYESSILFDQFHAFEPFAPEDIIFTHLDEVPRRVKLWNFVLGTNCPMSFLGAGQKIPGEFQRAKPALLFPG
jgi:flagellar biosynthesis protein FlhF